MGWEQYGEQQHASPARSGLGCHGAWSMEQSWERMEINMRLPRVVKCAKEISLINICFEGNKSCQVLICS